MEILVLAAFVVYVLFFALSVRLIPLDPDSANHLRLALAWSRGSKPIHSYSFGLKIGLPLLYAGVSRFIGKKPSRFRYLAAFGFSILHLTLASFLDDVQQNDQWILHAALCVLLLLPSSYPTSSSADLYQPALISLAFLFYSGSPSANGVWVISSVLAALILLNKVSDVLLAPVLLLFLASEPVAVLVSMILLLALAIFTLRISSKSEAITEYRRTRRFFRKKTVIPYFVLAPLYFACANLIELASLGPQFFISLCLLNYCRNVITGDHLTGAPSFPVTAYLALGCLTSNPNVDFVILIITLGACIQLLPALISLHKRLTWADGLRLVSVGDRYPGLSKSAKTKVIELNDSNFFKEDDVFILNNGELALAIGKHAASGLPYSVNHMSLWLQQDFPVERLLDQSSGRIITDDPGLASRIASITNEIPPFQVKMDSSEKLFVLAKNQTSF